MLDDKIKITFKRLLEIRDGSSMTKEESEVLTSKNSVYLILNDQLNKVYIGETTDIHVRLFTFWKEDKRHVGGINSPIVRLFDNDIDNTFFIVLEHDIVIILIENTFGMTGLELIIVNTL